MLPPHKDFNPLIPNPILMGIDTTQVLTDKFTGHLQTQRLSVNTITNYLYLLRSYLRHPLDQEGTDAFIRRHNNPVARAFLKQFLTFAHIPKTEILIKKFKGKHTASPAQIYTEKEIMQIALNMPTPRDSAWVITGFETGLRISELLGITPLNIDFQNLIIRGKGKGDKPFEQCITRDTADMLANLCEYTEENERIFNLSRRWALNMLRRISLEQTGRAARTHSLRHSLNVHLRKKGMPGEYRAVYLNQDLKQFGVNADVYGHITREEAHTKWRAIMSGTSGS